MESFPTILIYILNILIWLAILGGAVTGITLLIRRLVLKNRLLKAQLEEKMKGEEQ